MKMPSKKRRDITSKLFSGLARAFDVENYTMSITHEMAEDKDGIKEGQTLAAFININHTYRVLSLVILPRFFQLEPSHQAEVVLHEMCHTIMSHSKELLFLRGQATEENIREVDERSTEQISQIIWKLSMTDHMDYIGKHLKEYIREVNSL